MPVRDRLRCLQHGDAKHVRPAQHGAELRFMRSCMYRRYADLCARGRRRGVPVTRRLLELALVALVIAGASRRAAAYPQFQLSREQTCTGCHARRRAVACSRKTGWRAQKRCRSSGTSPEFMYGKLGTFNSFSFGGDLRGAQGYLQTPQRYLVGFPMQGDLLRGASTARASPFS